MAKKTRVLVVDDSAFARQTISQYIESIPSMEVVGKANNGLTAIEMVLKTKPDLITLDLDMPNLNGFGFLRWLMEERPTPVLVVSSLRSNKNVFKALDMGAIDFIEKPIQQPSIRLHEIEREFRRKLLLISALKRNDLQKYRHTNLTLNENILRQRSKKRRKLDEPLVFPHTPDSMVVIGASTGGPPALHNLVTNLPENFQCPVIICQHMPSGFTRLFAERLNKSSSLPVKEAEHGERITSGTVYIAPGGVHMVLETDDDKIKIQLNPRKKSDKYVPSIDQIMISVAEIFLVRCLAVVLTGMGDDGSLGVRRIRELGGRTIAQSKESSVVFGMPSKAIKTGAILEVLDLDNILENMIEFAPVFSRKLKKNT